MNYKKLNLKSIVKAFSIMLSLGILFIAFVNIYIIVYAKNDITNNLDSLKEAKVGLVLGAKVLKDGSPSTILKDRLNVAYEAYNKGIVNKLLLSGDNRVSHYNEPVNMEKYLVSLGVEKDDIYLDYAGFDTYDSLYRAREIFGAKELIVFTQEFHLYRSVYIGNRLGINTYGLKTDLQDYYGMKRNNIREVGARVKAFFDVEILNSRSKFLGEKISLNETQNKVY